jgi:hypothetical protein
VIISIKPGKTDLTDIISDRCISAKSGFSANLVPILIGARI